MTTKVYYIDNIIELDEALERIKYTFPCFIYIEFVEMDYSEIEIQARNEDFGSIERILAPLF